MPPLYLLDESCKRVTLGHELGRGGEAAVYVVQDNPQIVAKVYHRPLDAETAEKISRMVALKNERLLRLAAWPLETLRNGSGSSPAGVLMRNVSGFKDVHLLYSPKSRVREFSAKANWRFLVHAAGNVARAFSVIHEQGHVIGDVNQSNVRISPETGIANLIDCDSFQISFQGHYYLCKVGSPLYTPPELHGKDFSELVRTPNHDNFGLAVLLFHLLFMGRHPFAGRFLGRGDMPIENAIGEFRFAFAPDVQRTQIEPPPDCITLKDLSPEVGELFVKAFAPEGSQNGRPTGEQWAVTLDSFGRQLKACSADRAHVFFQRLLRCPWCALEGCTGVLLFLGYGVTYGDARFNIKTCWDRIMAVPGPGPAPPPDFKHVTANIKAARPARVANWISIGLSATVFAILCFSAMLSTALEPWMNVHPIVGYFAYFVGAAVGVLGTIFIIAAIGVRTCARFEAESRACDARLRAMEDRWQREASDSQFNEKLKGLKNLLEEYNDLPLRRQQGIHELERDLYNQQLTRFLESFDIASADIPHVKDSRKAMLSSYGIDTAADVNAKDLEAVPGFSDFLIAEVRDWRRSLEREFRFDSKQGVDPAYLRRVDQAFGERRLELESILSKGWHDLEETSRRISLARVQLRDELEKAHIAAVQAGANLKHLWSAP